HRRLDQVARLIARRFPSMGDQLLGIIEIVREFAAGPNGGEQGRSRALCEAAIGQVATQSLRYDFSQAVPHARHRLWAMIAAVPVVVALAAAVLAPAAAANAWARLLAPWKAVERFTFTRVEKLPQELVVPIGEPAPLTVGLAADTQWKPDGAIARVGRQRPLTAQRGEEGYAFTLPPQLDGSTLSLAVGDARGRTKIVPMLRPEIETVVAEVKLPEYLKRGDTLRQDVRGGSLSPVKGSTVTLAATATRDLATATVDGVEVTPEGATIRTGQIATKGESRVSLEWQDRHGLQGAKPLVLNVSPRNDDAPTVTTLDVPANREFLLTSDTLRFKIAVRDDFGIRRVGIEWEGQADEGTAPDKGDRLLQNGGPLVDAINDVAATFCPDALGVRPQPLVLRAFAEDYLPGRGRVYSPPMLVYVVDKAEHALLMNERLNRLRQDITEVKDREQKLFQDNVDLRLKPADSLLTPEGRQELEAHARAEDEQAERLQAAVEKGADLVREAGKNSEFDPATLQKLADDLKTLSDLSENKMPSVKDLLMQAAKAKQPTAAGKPSADQLAGKPSEGKPGEGKPGEGQPGEGQPGEGQPGEGKPGEGKPGEGKPGEGQPGEGKPGEGKPGQGKPGQGKPGQGKPGDNQQANEGGQEEGKDPADESGKTPGEDGKDQVDAVAKKGGGKPGEQGEPSPQGPKVGNDRNEQGGGEGGKPGKPADTVAPSVVD
ncbi:MAG: hypothetical protein ACK5SI_17485, partial [Planctomycetia bacterium]